MRRWKTIELSSSSWCPYSFPDLSGVAGTSLHYKGKHHFVQRIMRKKHNISTLTHLSWFLVLSNLPF